MKKYILVTNLLIAAALLTGCANTPKVDYQATTDAAVKAKEEEVREEMQTTQEAMAVYVETQQTTIADLARQVETLQAEVENAKAAQAEKPEAVAPEEKPAAKTNAPCYQGVFLNAVDFTDYQKIQLGKEFTMQWHVKNTGSCAWDPSFTFESVGKYDLSGVKNTKIGIAVNAGEEAILSLDMISPYTTGQYVSKYEIKTSDGTTFGFKDSESSNSTDGLTVKMTAIDTSVCSLVSVTPGKIALGESFTGEVTIRNNSGYTWDKGEFDVKVSSGTDLLRDTGKVQDYLDFPSSAKDQQTVTFTYDMIAPTDRSGNIPLNLTIYENGNVYCTLAAYFFFAN